MGLVLKQYAANSLRPECFRCVEFRNKDVDANTTRLILERAKILAPELLDPRTGKFDVVSEQVGFRPSRKGGPRVEVENVGGRVVVHSYGHSGAGYVYLIVDFWL